MREIELRPGESLALPDGTVVRAASPVAWRLSKAEVRSIAAAVIDETRRPDSRLARFFEEMYGLVRRRP